MLLRWMDGSSQRWSGDHPTQDLLIAGDHPQPSQDQDNVEAGSRERVDYHRWSFFLCFY